MVARKPRANSIVNLSIYALVSSKDLKTKSNPKTTSTIDKTHLKRGTREPAKTRRASLKTAECGALKSSALCYRPISTARA